MLTLAALPTLETERLVLRPFEMADAPAVQVLASARQIADTTLNIPHPYPDDGAAAWVAGHPGGIEKGRYPFLCTFPGHWMVMNGVMVVR